MKRLSLLFILFCATLLFTNCAESTTMKESVKENTSQSLYTKASKIWRKVFFGNNPKEITAADILGNPDYPAISYGGYRQKSRRIQPSVAELKEDMRILAAMGIKVLRTYNVHYPHASNVLRAIRELKEELADFEMYVMLGAWIDCKNAWTEWAPDHSQESEANESEIEIGRAHV